MGEYKHANGVKITFYLITLVIFQKVRSVMETAVSKLDLLCSFHMALVH